MTGGAVAAVQRYAAAAGATILAAGGNAADAAVAVAFAQGVVDPYRCGIGGGGMALSHDGATKSTSVLEFYGTAPSAARVDMFTPVGHWGTLFEVAGHANQFGHRASIVPGLVRGLARLHAEHGSGRVSWSAVLEPAVVLADGGFAAYPYFVRPMQQQSDHPFLGVARRTVTYAEPVRRVFAPDGEPPVIGQRFRQPDYARTLRRIAEHGPDDFYLGETAQRIVADFAANDGLLTEADLAGFTPRETPTLTGSYRDRRVVTEGAPSVGPTFLQLLRVMDGWAPADLPRWSTAYSARLIRAMNLVFGDRAEFIGDPEHTDVPLEMLLSEARADEHRATIAADVTGPHRTPHTGSGSRETTHCTVVDESGTAVLITHSVGSGSGVVTPGLGFMHNNHMIQFDPRPGRPNSIAPGKRPNIGGAPALVFDRDELVLAMGSPGGGLKATGMAQVLANITDFGMSPADAVIADRVHAEDIPMVVAMDPRFPPNVVVELAERGYQVDLSDYGARIAAVARDPETGALTPLADPRGDQGVATVASPLGKE